jgi:hypothetical protein
MVQNLRQTGHHTSGEEYEGMMSAQNKTLEDTLREPHKGKQVSHPEEGSNEAYGEKHLRQR